MPLVTLHQLRRIAIGCLWLFGGYADAAMIEGTFGIAPVGNITYTGSDLAHASSISLPGSGLINTIQDFYNGSFNDFSPATPSGPGRAAISLLSQVDLSMFVLPLVGGIPAGDAFRFSGDTAFGSGTTPNYRYDFDLQSLTRTSNGASTLDIYGLGILHDTENMFDDTPALISLAFTQSAPGAAVNVSLSLSTVAVPEPGTIGAAFAAFSVLFACVTFRLRN